MLTATFEGIGFYGTGIFTQTGGTHVAKYGIYISSRNSGIYNLSGGLLSGYQIYLDNAGTFNQTGGSNIIDVLRLGFYTHSQTIYNQSGGYLQATMISLGYPAASTSIFNLSGTGNINAGSEMIGGGGLGIFNQTGGTNSVGLLTLESTGEYNLSGGTLNIAGGFVNQGVLDCTGSGEIVISTPSILDFSKGNILNAGSKTLSVPSGSLVIVSTSSNLQNVFGSYTNAGMTHIAGTTLTVAADQSFGGIGNINDLVVCTGKITAGSGGYINLNNGLILFGNGSVNLGSKYNLGNGILTVEDTSSCIAGGTLSMYNQYVGKSGTGTFTQSAGTNIISHNLYLGYNSGSSGTYNLEGGNLITQSIAKGSGTAQFNFGGGTLQASDSFATELDMSLTGTGGNAKIDTAGHVVTLSGVLSGAGGLEKQGEGTLILSGNNTYTGETTVGAGILEITGTHSSGGKITVADGAGFVFGSPYTASPAPESVAGWSSNGTQESSREISSVPEPGMWVLFAASILSLAIVVRRRK